MRNRIIHGYFAVRLDVVWNTVNTDIPVLVETLREILRDENNPSGNADDPSVAENLPPPQ
jgi:uncharacterized protein with HEPN domain